MANISDQFGRELFRANLNIAELDGVPCAKCGIVPPIQRKKVNGKWTIDRSSRIDCDGGSKKENLVTYHRECWKEIASVEETEDLNSTAEGYEAFEKAKKKALEEEE